MAKRSLHSMMNQPPELLVGDTFISLALFLTPFFYNEPQGISEVIDFLNIQLVLPAPGMKSLFQT